MIVRTLGYDIGSPTSMYLALPLSATDDQSRNEIVEGNSAPLTKWGSDRSLGTSRTHALYLGVNLAPKSSIGFQAHSSQDWLENFIFKGSAGVFGELDGIRTHDPMIKSHLTGLDNAGQRQTNIIS
jgi:hypothetical protein